MDEGRLPLSGTDAKEAAPSRPQLPLSIKVLVSAFVVAGMLWLVGALFVYTGQIDLSDESYWLRVVLFFFAAGGLALMTAALLVKSRIGWWWAVAWGALSLADGVGGIIVMLDRTLGTGALGRFAWLEDGWWMSIVIGLALLLILMRPAALQHYRVGRSHRHERLAALLQSG